MTAPGGAPPVVFGLAGLDRLVEALIADGYRVIGPTVRDNAIVLAELDSAAELPAGWGVDSGPGYYRLRRRDDEAVFAHSAGSQSWKQFLHPPRRQLWATGGDGAFRPVAPRPLRISRRAGLRPGRHRDARAGAGRRGIPRRLPSPGARQGLFIIAADCTEPGGVCFCASMGTGPRLALATTSPSPSGSTRPGTGSW